MGWRAVVVLVVTTSCTLPRVSLVPPPPTATPKQRVQAFYGLSARQQVTEVTCNYNGWSDKCSELRSITLGDGRVVKDPRDVLPVVAPNSSAANHARAFTTARQRAIRYVVAGALVSLAGLGATIGFVTIENRTGALLGVGAVLTGIAIVVVGGATNGLRQRSETEEAFSAYNQGLAQNLGVCFTAPPGLVVAPCEALQPPPPPASSLLPTN